MEIRNENELRKGRATGIRGGKNPVIREALEALKTMTIGQFIEIEPGEISGKYPQYPVQLALKELEILQTKNNVIESERIHAIAESVSERNSEGEKLITVYITKLGYNPFTTE